MASTPDEQQPSKEVTGSTKASDAKAESDREDARLLSAFKSGDAKAFERLLRKHRRPVFNFCYRMLRDRSAAEDAFQEVFLRVVRSAPKWEESAKVTTWIYTIARNHCIDATRRAKYRRTTSLDQTFKGPKDGEGPSLQERLRDEAVVPPDRGAESVRMRPLILEAIGLLSEEQHEVFVMREYAGLPFREIAQVVGVSENTIKSRMRYALEHLRKYLAAHGIDGSVIRDGEDEEEGSRS
ncbi:MAG: RNA polymerase sigma factor [Deltaproteobacteria bacterium]|nr:RNA polymerase sigma factor [Deltaproteobacteria bacterium]